MTVFAQPLSETENQVEAERLGMARETRVVLEGPVGRARQGRHGPTAALDRQEEAKHQRLGERTRKRAVRETGGRRNRHNAPDKNVKREWVVGVRLRERTRVTNRRPSANC